MGMLINYLISAVDGALMNYMYLILAVDGVLVNNLLSAVDGAVDELPDISSRWRC